MARFSSFGPRISRPAGGPHDMAGSASSRLKLDSAAWSTACASDEDSVEDRETASFVGSAPDSDCKDESGPLGVA